MARTIDKTLADILKKYGADPATDIWDCHGTWVAYHRTLERIAAQAGITFEPPTMIRSEADECVICVTGHMGDRAEWSFGEAKIGLNYKVAGKQAGYPYAMAEKKLPEPQDQLIYAIVEEVKSLMAKDKLKWEQHVEVHSRKKYQQTKEDLWYRAMHWIYANNPSDEQVEELLSWTNRGGAKPKWVEEDTSGYW